MTKGSKQKYRLLTQCDFDGLISAILLRELDMIDDIQFVHPKQIQDNQIEITEKDILASLPYAPNCHLAFNHYLGRTWPPDKAMPKNFISNTALASTSRVIFEQYGGFRRFKFITEEILEAVDKSDAARFSQEEILHPTGWVLLSFIIDSRTGLVRYNNFGDSNHDFMMKLIEACPGRSIKDILESPLVRERVELYNQHEKKFIYQIHRSTSVFRNLLVLNLQNEPLIFVGNRFMVYALYPQCNLSIHVLPGEDHQTTVFAVGKSIINRTSTLDIGKLMREYGGGGHTNAGSCRAVYPTEQEVLNMLILKLTGQWEKVPGLERVY